MKNTDELFTSKKNSEFLDLSKLIILSLNFNLSPQCLDDYGDYMDTPPGPETCQKTSGGPACSGQGNCVCGVCKCNTDSRGIIYGRFCECDTWSCPKSRYNSSTDSSIFVTYIIKFQYRS